jgi:hypothetical protein
MKVKAIVVEGELPEGCYYCDLASDDDFGNTFCCVSEIADGIMDFDNKVYRHPHCPLITEREEVLRVLGKVHG